MANRIITFQYARDTYDAYKKQTIPASNECMTKADVAAYLNADMSVLSSYTNNQLVPRVKISPVSVYTIELRGYEASGGDGDGTLMTVYKNGTAYLNSSCYSYPGYSCLASPASQAQILAGDSFYLEFSYFSDYGYSYFTPLRVVYNSTTRGTLYDSGIHVVTTSSENFPEFTAVSGENITISVTLQ